MKKRNTLKIIDIIFYSTIIFKIVFYAIENVNDVGMTAYFSNITFIILFIISCIVKVILDLYWLIGIYIAFKIAHKRHLKGKLDEIDFKNDTYYRDIISKYSPGMLSYIDDFKLDEKDIVATLMSLELKRRIKIDNKIILLDEYSDDLDESEKYILDNIKNNTMKYIDINTFKFKVVNDCLKNGMLEKKVKKKISAIIYIIIYILIYGGVFLLIDLFSNIKTDNGLLLLLFIFGLLIMFLILVVYPVAMIIYLKSYNTMNKLNPFVRSKEAKNINSKLEGLKKFIEEYSTLSDKEYKDLILWENYLIYSVILGQNTKLVKEVMELIN